MLSVGRFYCVYCWNFTTSAVGRFIVSAVEGLSPPLYWYVAGLGQEKKNLEMLTRHQRDQNQIMC